MSRESSAHEERVTRDHVCRFVEHLPGGLASVIKWKISSQDPGSELTGLAGLLYNDKVDLSFVELGCVALCKASQPGSGNQAEAVVFIANFYALVLTLRNFQSPPSDTQNFRPLIR